MTTSSPEVPNRPRRPARPRLWIWAAGLVAGVAIGVAWVTLRGSSGSGGSPEVSRLQAATVLERPVDAPAATAPDTSGTAVPLVAARPRTLSLLYFGYTHCPDICPINMGALAAALRDLPASVRQRVHVVFVTVDPQRDTPSVVRKWLDAFDRSFVGLVPARPESDAVLRAMGLEAVTTQPVSGGYVVSHPGGIYVFTGDGKAHAMFTAGSPARAVAADLRLLVEGWSPEYS